MKTQFSSGSKKTEKRQTSGIRSKKDNPRSAKSSSKVSLGTVVKIMSPEDVEKGVSPESRGGNSENSKQSNTTTKSSVTIIKKKLTTTWKMPFFGVSLCFCGLLWILIAIIIIVVLTSGRDLKASSAPLIPPTISPDPRMNDSGDAPRIERKNSKLAVTFHPVAVGFLGTFFIMFAMLSVYLIRVHARLKSNAELTPSDLAAVRMITMDTREKTVHQSALSSITANKIH